MNTRYVNYYNEEILCKYYFDIDEQVEGIDVYNENDEFLGQIGNLEIPDPDDEEACEDFDIAVCDWLNENI